MHVQSIINLIKYICVCIHSHTVQQELLCKQYSVNTETLENKREPSYIVGGNTATMENSIVVAQKMKKRPSYDLLIPCQRKP